MILSIFLHLLNFPRSSIALTKKVLTIILINLKSIKLKTINKKLKYLSLQQKKFNFITLTLIQIKKPTIFLKTQNYLP